MARLQWFPKNQIGYRNLRFYRKDVSLALSAIMPQ